MIDYWFTSDRKLQAAVGLPCALNLSDHVHIELTTDLCIGSTDGTVPQKVEDGSDPPIKPKIRWNKTDLDMYSCILAEKLPPLLNITPTCDMDVDLMATTLNSILYSALQHRQRVVPSPNREKKTLPIWNDTISEVVERSKQAHKE